MSKVNGKDPPPPFFWGGRGDLGYEILDFSLSLSLSLSFKKKMCKFAHFYIETKFHYPEHKGSLK